MNVIPEVALIMGFLMLIVGLLTGMISGAHFAGHHRFQ